MPQPDLGRLPSPFHRGRGNANNLGRFFNRQAPKEPQLDQLTQARVHLGQARQGFVESYQIQLLLLLDPSDRFIKSHFDRAPASLCRTSFAGMVHQDVPHRSRRDAEEMGTVHPPDLFLIDESNKRLIDQRVCLHGLVGLAAAEKSSRQPSQLGVDQRYELVQGLAVPVAPLDQELGQLLRPGRSQLLALRF